MKRLAAGFAQLALVSALLCGIGMAGIGSWSYFKGKRVAVLERNAHWQGVVDVLQRDHRKAVEDEAARVRAIEETWRLQRQGADHERERERAANAARLAAVAADRDRLRDQLAAAAAGGVAEADDSIAACRDRAAAFGRVLGEALRASAECTAAAEDLSTSVRTLQRAWPTNEVKEP